MADFTCISIWQGFVYVDFVIDIFARFIVDVLPIGDITLGREAAVQGPGDLSHRGMAHCSLRFEARPALALADKQSPGWADRQDHTADH